jgi:hypothetical protein
MRERNGSSLGDAKTRIVMTLTRGGERFEAVIRHNRLGTHELQYLWNQRPFISAVFQRGTAHALMESVRKLKDELLGRGWQPATNE